MKRRFLAILTCLCLSLSALMAKSLVLTLTDGTLVYYLLGGEVNPVMHLVDGGVMVNADSYSFSDLKDFRISLTDDPSGIEHMLSDARVSYSHNVLAIPSVGPEAVQVYSIDGAQVHPTVHVEAGFLFVDLGRLPQGVYVVNVAGTSLKVMKNN